MKKNFDMELSALIEMAKSLQNEVRSQKATSKPRKGKKMTKAESNQWKLAIINEVRRNDQIRREDLIRNLIPYAKKGKGKYQKLYWQVSNMVRTGELFPKGGGLSVHLLQD